MFEKHLWKSDILSKDVASKNQLPGLSISGTLFSNGLIVVGLKLHLEYLKGRH